MNIFDDSKTLHLNAEELEVVRQSLNIHRDNLLNGGGSAKMMTIDVDFIDSILLKLK